MSLSGHFWTLAPHVQRCLFARSVVHTQDYSCQVCSDCYGLVNLYGQLSTPPNARELLIVVHGLGGSSESGYSVAAATVAIELGLACLRLNQRGAEGGGEDYYHAGLWGDLDVVITDPRFSHYDAIYLLGYSIGGQLCLHWATKSAVSDSRVRAVAAVCAPLDLARTARTLDSRSATIYRRHILQGLKRSYRAVAARRVVPVPTNELRRISFIHDWDNRITAPHFGFRNAEHYYTETSVGPHLPSIRYPALLVVAERDPMVPIETVEPSLVALPSHVVVQRLARGGHIGFPSNTSLGQPGPLGVEPQLLTWFRTTS